MPEIGEVQKAVTLGYKGNGDCVYLSCPSCGKGRWVRRANIPESGRLLCRPCRKGAGHSGWSGGRHKNTSGYITIWVAPEDFFRPMAGKGNSVMEHRLVMAKHLNRCLSPWEVVHHRNGIKDDNRLENLQLLPGKMQHLVDVSLKRELARLRKMVGQLQQRVTLLEAENAAFMSVSPFGSIQIGRGTDNARRGE